MVSTEEHDAVTADPAFTYVFRQDDAIFYKTRSGRIIDDIIMPGASLPLDLGTNYSTLSLGLWWKDLLGWCIIICILCLVYPLCKPRRMYQLDDEVGDLAATIRDEEMKIVQQVETSCRVGRQRVEEMKMLKILSGCRDVVWSQVAECVFAEEVRRSSM